MTRTQRVSLDVVPHEDAYGLHLPPELDSETLLMTGDQYEASLRDGRRVIDHTGREVEDVTAHPQLQGGIETLARYYDAQFDPATRDITTFTDPETGKQAPVQWMRPRTKEDLRRRREALRLSTYQTLGTFGRPPDYGPLLSTALVSVLEWIEELDPRWASNTLAFDTVGLRHNLMSADIVADVQSDRRVPAGELPGRLRVVEERSDGVVLYGAKPCTSVGVQAHLGIIHTLLSPGIEPEATIFAAVPMNAPGITHLLREPVTQRAPAEDHPVGTKVGEESDALMIFDHVFVPLELIFTFRRQELLNKYHEIGRLPLWHIMTRIAYKAQIFAGAAQLIVDVLGTDQIPQVRDLVAEVTAYADTMMAFVIAAEETGEVRSGIFVPNSRYITVGRLYSITEYPRILQLLRELSGQGLISRFTKAQWERPDIGAKLDEFLPGTGVSARDKNRLFNFVWDLTSSEAALRTALFENVNATPAAAMRGRIYAAHDRSEWVRFVKEFAGMELGEER